MLSDAVLTTAGGTFPAAAGDARGLLLNFVAMSVCFSVNHGTVSAVIALSTSLLGTGLGSINLGTLWLMYVLTALVFATTIIQALGPKGGLLFGTLGYCLYVLSFLLAAAVAPSEPIFPEADAAAACAAIVTSNATGSYPCAYSLGAGEGEPSACACASCPPTFRPFVTVEGSLCATGAVKLISLLGAGMGGVAAGFLWSAQGAYFARNAELYAEAGGTIPCAGPEPASKERATAFFSSVFAALYLGLEVVMRLLSSIKSIVPTALLLPTYGVAALASACGMLLIMRLPPAVPPPEKKPLLQKVAAATQLLASHRPLQLLAPTEMVFGFAAAMMNSYVNGALVGCKVRHALCSRLRAPV